MVVRMNVVQVRMLDVDFISILAGLGCGQLGPNPEEDHGPRPDLVILLVDDLVKGGVVKGKWHGPPPQRAGGLIEQLKGIDCESDVST